MLLSNHGSANSDALASMGTIVIINHAALARIVQMATSNPSKANALANQAATASDGADSGTKCRKANSHHHTPQPSDAKAIESIQVRWRRRTTTVRTLEIERSGRAMNPLSAMRSMGSSKACVGAFASQG